MNKFALLMFGLAGIGMYGCAVDSAPSEKDGEQAQDEQAQDAKTETPDSAVAPKTVGQGHVIRLANTQLCLRPLNGETTDAPTELVACSPSTPNQNWIQVNTSGGTELVNVASQKCLWAFGDIATTGTGIGVLGCNVDGTNSPASNALWNLSHAGGFGQIQSKLGHKNTGFCLDHESGGQQLTACNGATSEQWEVGVE